MFKDNRSLRIACGVEVVVGRQKKKHGRGSEVPVYCQCPQTLLTRLTLSPVLSILRGRRAA